jgi:acetyltransferase-like isoleucine patch superfamily enzyme
MKFSPVAIDSYANDTNQPVLIHDTLRLNPGAQIYRTTCSGPLFLDRNARLGPEVKIGRYCSLGESTLITRGTVGSFCAVAARVAINPFDHPMDWLSIHEFQFRSDSYGWVPEYRDMQRLSRTPDMFSPVALGNDIWVGTNVTIMGGVTIGDGAVIGAGSVVTKDVPPYAVVVGVPATVKKKRFSDKIIERLLAAKWWDLELSELSGLPFRDIERALAMIEDIRAKKVVAAE